MSWEQQALLEVMQEACTQGEHQDADLTALLDLITEKLIAFIKPK